MAPVPSPIVVSDFDSMAQNFGQNAQRAFCDLTYGVGTYAIGARILGLAKFTPQTSLIASGALVASLALCPSGASENAIFGSPPGYTGGQCPVGYRTRVVGVVGRAPGGGGGSAIDEQRFGFGPIRLIQSPTNDGTGLTNYRVQGADGQAIHAIRYGPSNGDELALTVVRNDGLPDDCGNQSSEGGQIVSGPGGDTLDPTTVVDNSGDTLVIPVTVNMGGISNVINLPFSNFRIGSLLPFRLLVNVGGVDFGFERKPDGSNEPFPVSPDEEVDPRKYKELLEKIRQCVCNPPVELESFDIPFVESSVSCDLDSARVQVPKDSIPPSLSLSLLSSAQLASEACLSRTPEQLPENLLYSDMTTRDRLEIFTPEIDPEVFSLRIRITDQSGFSLPKISTYPSANQYKYGSVAFVLDGIDGGGDYLYVFDKDTYYQLPTRAKKGRLRVLFSEGLAFQVWDTGERVSK